MTTRNTSPRSHFRNRANQATILILSGVALRSMFISAPLVDLASWRETQTAMITRNLVRNGFDIFHPTIDWFGNAIAYLALEFPFYNLVVGIFYAMFGEYDIFGRIVSMMFSAGTLTIFWFVARIVQAERSAVLSLFCFALCPLSVFYGQAYMPESAMLFLSVWAAYFLLRWSMTSRRSYLAACAVIGALAFLVKAPVTIQLFFPIIFVFWERYGITFISRKDFILHFVALYLPVAVWVLYSRSITHPFFPGESFSAYVGEIQPRLQLMSYVKIGGFALVYLFTPVGVVLFLRGLMLRVGDSRDRFVLVWLGGTVVYLLVFFPALEGHHYYLLPLVPAVSLYAGKGLTAFNDYAVGKGISLVLRRATATFLLVGSLAFIVLPLSHLSGQDRMIIDAAASVRTHTHPSDLILTASFHAKKNSFGNPALLYHSQRKGWIELYPYDIPKLLAAIARYRNEGARYLVVTFARHYVARSFLEQFSSHEPDFDGPEVVAELARHFRTVDSGDDFVLFQL